MENFETILETAFLLNFIISEALTAPFPPQKTVRQPSIKRKPIKPCSGQKCSLGWLELNISNNINKLWVLPHRLFLRCR